MPTEDGHHQDLHQEMDSIIAQYPFRKAVYDAIPAGSRNILDFGCNQGELLLRLKRDKGCRDLYGVEINEGCRDAMARHLDGAWIMDISAEDADFGRDYDNFFNYMILHDVVEHLYDPWFVLGKLRRSLAPDGIGKEYLFYLANKILLCCKPRETHQTPERIKVGGLEARRRKNPMHHSFSWH